MRPRLFDKGAAKRSVSLTINGDLYAKAEAAGIDLARVAEQAIVEAYRAQVKAEIEQDLAAIDAYEAEHGSFAAMMREHADEKEANASA